MKLRSFVLILRIFENKYLLSSFSFSTKSLLREKLQSLMRNYISYQYYYLSLKQLSINSLILQHQ